MLDGIQRPHAVIIVSEAKYTLDSQYVSLNQNVSAWKTI